MSSSEKLHATIRRLPVIAERGWRRARRRPRPIEYSRSRAAGLAAAGVTEQRPDADVAADLSGQGRAGRRPECSSVRISPANASASTLRPAALSKSDPKLGRHVAAPQVP